jgi:hypothetical protein
MPSNADNQWEKAHAEGHPMCANIPKPHPEERPQGASRRMAARYELVAILRDAVLRTAPQDEVGDLRGTFVGNETMVSKPGSHNTGMTSFQGGMVGT